MSKLSEIEARAARPHGDTYLIEDRRYLLKLVEEMRDGLVHYSEICDCKPNPVSEPHDENCHLQRARALLAKLEE
jgi:hypothetical protein